MAAFMPGNQPRRNPFGAPPAAPGGGGGGTGAPMQGGAPPAPAQPAPEAPRGMPDQGNNGAAAAAPPAQVPQQGGAVAPGPQGGGPAPSLGNKTGGFLGGAGSGGAGGAGNLAQRAMAGRQADANAAGGKGQKGQEYPLSSNGGGNVYQGPSSLSGTNDVATQTSSQQTQGGGGGMQGALSNLQSLQGNQGQANAAGGKGVGGGQIKEPAPQGGGGYEASGGAIGGGGTTGNMGPATEQQKQLWANQKPQAYNGPAYLAPQQAQGPQSGGQTSSPEGGMTGVDNQGAANAAGGKGQQPQQTTDQYQGQPVGAPAPPRPGIGQNRLRATR